MPVLSPFPDDDLQSHHRGLTTVVLYLKLQDRRVSRDQREQEHQNGMDPCPVSRRLLSSRYNRPRRSREVASLSQSLRSHHILQRL